MKLKSFLAAGGMFLLAVGFLSGTARAQDRVFETTRYENGQSVRVYTNTEAQRFHSLMRVRRNRDNDGAFIANIPTRPVSLARRPNIMAGPVPRLYSFTESTYKELPRRVIVYASRGEGSGPVQTNMVNLSEVILKEARTYNVDPLLVELVIKHESNFNHLAVSRSGAQGLMQLMPTTAAGLGVSEPFNPEQNVAGGVQYLAAQLSRFQDLRLALAAYNAGPGSVEQFGGMPPYGETMNYVNSIVSEYEARKQGKKPPEREAARDSSSESKADGSQAEPGSGKSE